MRRSSALGLDLDVDRADAIRRGGHYIHPRSVREVERSESAAAVEFCGHE